MSDFLYLYTQPFVVKNTPSHALTHLIDYLDEMERNDLERINGLVLKFAVDKGVLRDSDGKFLPSLENSTGSPLYILNWTNLRTLTEEAVLDNVLQSFNSNDGSHISEILDLHGRLGASFDHRLLNTIVNRTMTSIALISSAKLDLTWQTIHRKYPFIWLIIFIQSIVRSIASPLPQ